MILNKTLSVAHIVIIFILNAIMFLFTNWPNKIIWLIIQYWNAQVHQKWAVLKLYIHQTPKMQPLFKFRLLTQLTCAVLETKAKLRSAMELILKQGKELFSIWIQGWFTFLQGWISLGHTTAILILQAILYALHLCLWYLLLILMETLLIL